MAGNVDRKKIIKKFVGANLFFFNNVPLPPFTQRMIDLRSYYNLIKPVDVSEFGDLVMAQISPTATLADTQKSHVQMFEDPPKVEKSNCEEWGREFKGIS